MNKFQLESGAIIQMNLAPVDKALELYRTILNACKNTNLDLNVQNLSTLQDLLAKNMESVLNIFSSNEVLETIKNCAEGVLYNKVKFSMELFEEEEARGDFIPFLQLVAYENLRPFFPQARFIFETLTSLILKN